MKKSTKIGIRETKVNVYKKLLQVLGQYSLSVPSTGVDKLFDKAVELGKSIMPTDKRALCIIEYILEEGSVPGAVQKLLNIRFADLPAGRKPLIKIGKKHLVACWCKDGSVFDSVRSLLDFEGTKAKGYWSDLDGDKVSLIDDSVEGCNK